MREIFSYAAGASRLVTFAVAGVVLLGLVAQLYASLPTWGLEATTVEIEPGSSVRDIGATLRTAGVVRSSSAFAIVVALAGAESSLVAGTYAFEKPESLPAIVRRLRTADTRIPMVEVTLPEGLTRKEMAALLAPALPRFSAAAFLKSTEGEEGYLFPDTYRFDLNVDAEAVADRLRDNFRRRTEAVEIAAASSGRTFSDVVKMASIVEREATADSRAMVAGILWARLDEDHPLQVDAPFVYAIGRASAELTQEDLLRDGPYNTYVRKGLTPTPIGNPGLAALDATIHPQQTAYRYFLTGSDGKMYFAKTFEGHQVNRERHL